MTTKLSRPDYLAFLAALKQRILSARISAARAVNSELVLLYWDIGRGIVEKQESLGWGDSVVETLAHDLQRAFPEMRGFAPRSLWNMRRLFLAYSSPEILPQLVAEMDGVKTRSLHLEKLRQVVAKIPWGHHLTILDRHTDPAARLYYLRATARFGWSRNVLLALKTKVNPIGVAEYQLQPRLPARFRGRLPTAKQLADAVRDVLPRGK